MLPLEIESIVSIISVLKPLCPDLYIPYLSKLKRTLNRSLQVTEISIISISSRLYKAINYTLEYASARK